MRRLTFTACMAAMMGLPAFAGLVAETPAGAGNTIATAQGIPAGAFTLPIPATVFPGLGPTATIQGGLQTSSDIDFYSFVLLAGATVNFDVDNDPLTFDTVLSLFNSAGTLLAYDDDSSPADTGSNSGLDSYIGALNLAAGTYYIAISQFANFPTAVNGVTTSNLVRPDGLFGGNAVTGATIGLSTFGASVSETAAGGAAYNLHISVGQSAVPEPSSFALLGLGLTAAFVSRKRRARKLR